MATESESSGHFMWQDVLPLLVLWVLAIVSFRIPISFSHTNELVLFQAVSPFFWIALSYGVVFPFVWRRYQNPTILTIWGATVFCLSWGYFTAAEPGLRYWDSFYHSQTTRLLMTGLTDPSTNAYLLFPGAFLFHAIFSIICGVNVFISSRILAVTFMFLIGIIVTAFFSHFFDLKKALLCLYVFSTMPDAIMPHHQHYSPQTVAYFLATLLIILLYRFRTSREKTKTKPRSFAIVSMMTLLAIVLIHPTTTLLLIPFLSLLFLVKFLVKQEESFLSLTLLMLFLTITAAWWLFQQNSSEILGGWYIVMVNRLFEALTTGKITLSQGLFTPSNPPYYSVLIRQMTFVLVGILLLPSMFKLMVRISRQILNYRKGQRLSRNDAMFATATVSSVSTTIVMWTATAGLFGDRTWGILALFLAVLCIMTIDMLAKTKKAKAITALLVAMLIVMFPLNVIALHHNEALTRTTLAEVAAINRLYHIGIHDEKILSDDLGTLYRLRWAQSDASNTFMKFESYNPMEFADSDLLLKIPWTFFTHSQKSHLFFYTRFGIDIGNFDEFSGSLVNKIYDNCELRFYPRAMNQTS